MGQFRRSSRTHCLPKIHSWHAGRRTHGILERIALQWFRNFSVLKEDLPTMLVRNWYVQKEFLPARYGDAMSTHK